MNNTPRTLTLLPESFAICRLAADSPIPAWAMPGKASFLAITLTHEELSIICPEHLVPADTDIPAFTGWRCLKLEGPIALDEPGVLAALVVPMAAVGISVFAEATYDTDYLLVNQIEKAIQSLEEMGHRVVQ
ncbi:ACT domain-containing protein [Thiothrix lacustris]|uniref:ACT domain-containing protein n=1 Tax=Thiothrix lacustris TaxID=525917 RepID=UPI0027E5A1C0|nr:ACT domain-containing protein [Thiothrix lacustris]WMP19442.1 ACT domain-containing protein [Thiothrix lacustris]